MPTTTPDSARRTIDIAALIDEQPLGRAQIVTFALCALCLIIDGFDVQALGYAAPAIVRDWGVPNSALGPVFGAANFGVLIGGLVFSMVADKIGRRPVIIGATFFFAVMTLVTAGARTVEELLLLRFIAGIGMGSIVPNATALVGEYSPTRRRITLMMCITVGFTAGAAIGGFIAAWLIPTFGWRAVFYFGGTVPLVIGVAMLRWLPESLQFMAVRRRDPRAIRRWLERIAPHVPADAELIAHEEHRPGVPMIHLFRDGRTPVTLLLWVVNFMNLLNLYALASWLPTVVRDAGHSTSTAVIVGSILQVGGTIGTFGLAWVIVRRGFVPVLASSFAIASLSIAMIGSPSLSLTALAILVFVAGWCVVGAQPGINAFAATYYPTYLRSTGVGWGLGIGRIGAVVGPVLGGEFMRLQWSTQDIFLAASVPALISAIVMFSLRWLVQSSRRP